VGPIPLPHPELRKRRPGRVHVVPVPPEGLDDPGDGLPDGLLEHRLPVDDELGGHLVAVLEAEDISFRVLRLHLLDIEPLGFGPLLEVCLEVLVRVLRTPPVGIVRLIYFHSPSATDF